VAFVIESNELSEREREVAALLLQGKGNKQIAAALDITVRTVEFHLSNIYSKLKVASRTEAALKLAGVRLRESTGALEGCYSRESAVDVGNEPADNGGKPVSRRIGVKNWLYIIGGGLLVVGIVAILVFARSLAWESDYHSDEEIAQEAMQSAGENLDSTEMRIVTGDPVQIGTVVLNQFLKKFRQRETHYSIRLVSYEVLELDFIEETPDQLTYTARIKVMPQDRTRFTEILDGVFPYEENDDGIFVSFGFTVFRQGDTYKLVDVSSDMSE
jgi:DNA-binding CsgD family transcriptional regulator